MNRPPPITVLMPVFNGREFLAESVQSILHQTFRDFEFLVINDGSTDGSHDFLLSLKDPRIRIISQPKNCGIVAALNLGLEAASGYYVARMDADDVAQPGRLATQFGFMEKNPEVGLCGTTFQTFDEKASHGWVRHLRHSEMLVALLFENPICHPTVLMRRSVLREAGLRYPAEYPHAEEYALWVKLSRVTRLANLPESLLHYRIHSQQVSQRKTKQQSRSIDEIITEQLKGLGLAAAPHELEVHKLLNPGIHRYPAFPRTLRGWSKRILEANARSTFLPQDELSRQLHERTAAAIAWMQSEVAAMSPLRRVRWRLKTWLKSWLFRR